MELRFKQIESNTILVKDKPVYVLYGLDNDGRIWHRDNKSGEWKPVSMKAYEGKEFEE